MPRYIHELGIGAATILVLAGSLQSQGAPPAQDYSKAIQAVQSVVDKNLSAYDRAGLSLVFVEGDRSVWSGEYGLADREKGVAVTEATTFELGSLSKIFTCVAIMQLHEQKKIDIDRPFTAYVPDFSVQSRFPTGKDAITIRMLMTHHSGIMTDDDPWETAYPERYFYRAVLEYVKGTSLLFPPGQRWHYSSFGVNLLGLLVERVSGMEFSAYMKQHVLGPLRMPNASFDSRDLDPQRIAAGYFYHPNWDKIPKDEIRPAGSLKAPMKEAAHLLSMILNHGVYQGERILTPGSVGEMIRIQDDENPLDHGNYMGLGFRANYENLKDGRWLPIFGHAGVARHRSMLVLVPEWNLGLISSVNDTNAKTALLWGSGNALLKEVFAMHGEVYEAVRPLPGPLAGKLVLPKGALGAYATVIGYRTLELDPDGTLYKVAPGVRKPRDREDLYPLSDGTFLLGANKEEPLVFRFETGPGGVVGAQVRSNGKLTNTWQKLAPQDSTLAWAGTYTLVEGASGLKPGISEIQVLVEGGQLLIKAANEDTLGSELADVRFPLRLLSESQAEVVNGALSGFDGYKFEFEMVEGLAQLRLRATSGVAFYRRKP